MATVPHNLEALASRHSVFGTLRNAGVLVLGNQEKAHGVCSVRTAFSSHVLKHEPIIPLSQVATPPALGAAQTLTANHHPMMARTLLLLAPFFLSACASVGAARDGSGMALEFCGIIPEIGG